MSSLSSTGTDDAVQPQHPPASSSSYSHSPSSSFSSYARFDDNTPYIVHATLGDHTRLIQEQKSKEKYMEYQLVCRIESRHSLHEWVVWKRYSDLKKFHAKLAINGISNLTFPSAHSLSSDKFSDHFVDIRRKELKSYWEKLQNILNDNNGGMNFLQTLIPCRRLLEEFVDAVPQLDCPQVTLEGECEFPECLEVAGRSLQEVQELFTYVCDEMIKYCDVVYNQLNCCAQDADGVLWNNEGRTRMAARQSILGPEYSQPPRVPRISKQQQNLLQQQHQHQHQQQQSEGTDERDYENMYIGKFAKSRPPDAYRDEYAESRHPLPFVGKFVSQGGFPMGGGSANSMANMAYLESRQQEEREADQDNNKGGQLGDDSRGMYGEGEDVGLFDIGGKHLHGEEDKGVQVAEEEEKAEGVMVKKRLSWKETASQSRR